MAAAFCCRPLWTSMMIIVVMLTTSVWTSHKHVRELFLESLIAGNIFDSGRRGGYSSSSATTRLRGGGDNTTNEESRKNDDDAPTNRSVVDDDESNKPPPAPPQQQDPIAALFSRFSNFSRISNLNIAFVGDSVMRYQYLDLVYFLKHGHWTSDVNDDAFQVKFHRYPNGTYVRNFAQTTNGPLAPQEHCDCYLLPEGVVGNRYFKDERYNNHVVYIGRYGLSRSWGHWWPHQVYDNHSLYMQVEPFAWWNYTWRQVLVDHIAKITPKPDYVIINEGLWPHHALLDPSQRIDAALALQEMNMTGIYKTTTSNTKYLPKLPQLRAHDAHMSQLLQPYTFDMAWTDPLMGPTFRWDEMHFKDATNHVINRHFLDFLKNVYQHEHGIDITKGKPRIATNNNSA